jgi:hypothetical protein
MEVIMWYRLSIAATAGLMLGGAGAAAAELPTYEVMGLPITPHQLAALGPANAHERGPAPTLLLAGMPASPHQIAVLTPRQKVLEEQIASSGGRATEGLARLSPVVASEPVR